MRRFAWTTAFGAACTLVFLVMVLARSGFPVARNHKHLSTAWYPKEASRYGLIRPGHGDDGRGSSLLGDLFRPEEQLPPKHIMDCDFDMEHLRRLQEEFDLHDKFEYTKRYVRFTRSENLTRQSITNMDQSLMVERPTIIRKGYNHGSKKCAAPLEVNVPESGLPAVVNASTLMFGVSTTYTRFTKYFSDHLSKEWGFWLTDGRNRTNGGTLLLTLADASDEELRNASAMISAYGFDVEVYHSNLSHVMSHRYFDLIPRMYMHSASASKNWLVLCDDDTFFPNMHALLEELQAHDHTMEKYIGTLSENAVAVDTHGSQAFGGAGAFFSLPLARRLVENYDSCTTGERIEQADRGWGPQGDSLIENCVRSTTAVRMTYVPELWQLDTSGDISGFYESGIKPLSLHHYRTWHKLDPYKLSQIAYTCGEDCIMLRFQTADNFILSGYSVAHYPLGIDFDTAQFEGTMFGAPRGKEWSLDYAFGPQRPSLHKTGRKIAWELQESELGQDGSVLQTYIRRGNDTRWQSVGQRAKHEVDGVIELVWLSS